MSTVNGTILDPAVPFDRRLPLVVDRWRATGGHLVTGKAFFLVYCWFLKHGHAGRSALAGSPDVREFVAAALAAVGGGAGWDATLRERAYCGCGSTNRLENMSICVDCASYQCWECAPGHAGPGHEVVG
ncbi:hypothetical protein R8Z50_12635 [Longispora sp. K20-0274]|uniref:hypothetical protein n=1 Tax=Longispora sp. K20-0274 TaxID=3088255 RepID=UPI003999DCAE